VLYDFGATALQMDLVLDAIPAFEKLHEAYPQEPAYMYALAMARFRRGDAKEAERLVKSYVETRPGDAAGHYLLAAVLHNLSQLAEARAAVEASLKLKADPDAEYLYGLILYDEGNRAAAVEALRRVVAARPGHAAALAALGTAYRDQGNFAEARAALERSVELDPKDLRANYQLGLVYAKLGDQDAAKKMFERADALRDENRKRETVVLKLIDPPQD
jgi:tetratricopeptide (TPR) repeat protein